MTEEIIELIHLRRNLKNNNTDESQEEYIKVRNEINRKTKLAKEAFLQEKCNEVGEMMKTGRLESAFKTVKTFFGTGKAVGL